MLLSHAYRNDAAEDESALCGMSIEAVLQLPGANGETMPRIRLINDYAVGLVIRHLRNKIGNGK